MYNYFMNTNQSSLLKNKDHRTKIITFITMLYNFFWAIVKIFFGIFMSSYLYCISGIYTLLLGFSKKTFISNHKATKEINIETKALIIGILLTVSGLAFGFYMGGIYFWKINFEYSLIWSIAIAFCSFLELGVSIYNLIKVRKKDDILLFSLRCCNIGSSLFAIVMTQVALLSATQTENTYLYNATFGIVASVLVIILGFIVIGKSAYDEKRKNELKNKVPTKTENNEIKTKNIESESKNKN